MANKAAWLKAKQAYPFTIDDAPMPQPGPHDITVKVRAVAINPVDMAVQAMGIIYEDYPRILGIDTAGEVTTVGSAVSGFKVGDRVIGSFHDYMEGQGSFQLYCNLKDSLTAKLPDNIAFKDSCVLPLAMCTACTALFEDYNLGLPFPQVEPEPVNKVILVWGGASSVGSCGIQAAKSAGLEVAATASAKNFDYCRSIGADHVFDYKSDTVVDDVVSALKGKEFAGVFAAVMGEDVYNKGAEIATKLGGKQMVATVLPPAMKHDRPLPGGVELGYSKSATPDLLRVHTDSLIQIGEIL